MVFVAAPGIDCYRASGSGGGSCYLEGAHPSAGAARTGRPSGRFATAGECGLRDLAGRSPADGAVSDPGDLEFEFSGTESEGAKAIIYEITYRQGRVRNHCVWRHRVGAAAAGSGPKTWRTSAGWIRRSGRT